MTEEPEAADWDEYDSVQMFCGCSCDHDATDHKGAWGDWREGDGCLADECPCEAEWEHA